jgi:hypothetical protein
LSDHWITLRRYRFGISSSAGKMASRGCRIFHAIRKRRNTLTVR